MVQNKIKLNYIVIPSIVFLVAFVGSLITEAGMGWYETINLPLWTPAGFVIGIAWTTIFILTAVSVLIAWNRLGRGSKFNWIMALFVLNGILNVFWSYLFFGQHLLCWAVIESGLLGLSVILLIWLIRPRQRLAAVLLYPYAIWVSFATYLAYTVWSINL